MGYQRKYGVNQKMAERLGQLLEAERKLTARWYSKMSGEEPWFVGERERLSGIMDSIAADIDTLIYSTK